MDRKEIIHLKAMLENKQCPVCKDRILPFYYSTNEISFEEHRFYDSIDMS